ncbi:PP0621 family protein [Acidovorax lacteus]|uniref:Deaminase n=1 Tax=Acidovorax lacteus TaxID=1924988 RepID=A0ABP8KXZ6_9BURK
MKYLVLLLVIGVAVALWSSQRRRQAPAAQRRPAAPPSPQDMVACAHCGVHLPRSDALLLGNHSFCCEEHRRLGARS